MNSINGQVVVPVVLVVQAMNHHHTAALDMEQVLVLV
jgi:hypothetical protein